MAKIMDPLLPILSILGYWAIVLGSFGGPGTFTFHRDSHSSGRMYRGCAEKMSGRHRHRGDPPGRLSIV